MWTDASAKEAVAVCVSAACGWAERVGAGLRTAGPPRVRRRAAPRFAGGALRCSQRRLAPRNSLRELRSLRSNRRGENEDDARCARAPALLRFSAAHKRSRGRPAVRNRAPTSTGPALAAVTHTAAASFALAEQELGR